MKVIKLSNYFYILILMNRIYNKVAEELGLTKDIVKEAYRMYFKFIQETMASIPEEALIGDNKIRKTFNIPGLGKFIVKQKKRRENGNKYKED